jgi:hypothetical protein
VARMLKESGRYEPVFLFAHDYPTIARDIAICEAEKLAYLCLLGAQVKPLSSEPSPDEKLPLTRRLVKRLQSYLPESIAKTIKFWLHGQILDSGYYFWKLNRRLQDTIQLIRQEGIALMVLGGDVVHYDTSVFIKAAHLEHIPAVLVPGWMTSVIEAAEAFGYDPAYSLQRWSNRLMGRLYPRWVYEYKGRKLLRLPAGQVLAREWLGLAPPSPWTLHSGYVDAITVESEAMYQYCVSEGLPTDQLVLTGSINHDSMAKALQEVSQRRAELCYRLNLSPNRPIILSALPPDELYRVGGRPECDFQIYDELVQFWIQSLAAIKGYNVIISLHPSIKYEKMKYIEQWGVKIVKEHTVNLVPLCDIFVASVSTTIQWAIVCGKPVVNYDVYRYRYTDFVEAKGVATMEEKEEFLSTLRRLTEGRAFYAQMAAGQAASASRWGYLDGQAGERVLNLFDQLIAKYED